jgi:hypothetical protein
MRPHETVEDSRAAPVRKDVADNPSALDLRSDGSVTLRGSSGSFSTTGRRMPERSGVRHSTS